MTAVRVHNFSMSVDGYVAGPDQSIDDPLGKGGTRLHEWAFATRSFRSAHGMDGGNEVLDNDWLARGEDGIGATIMGRNMFGPIRGPWPDGKRHVLPLRHGWDPLSAIRVRGARLF